MENNSENFTIPGGLHGLFDENNVIGKVNLTIEKSLTTEHVRMICGEGLSDQTVAKILTLAMVSHLTEQHAVLSGQVVVNESVLRGICEKVLLDEAIHQKPLAGFDSVDDPTVSKVALMVTITADEIQQAYLAGGKGRKSLTDEQVGRVLKGIRRGHFHRNMNVVDQQQLSDLAALIAKN